MGLKERIDAGSARIGIIGLGAVGRLVRGPLLLVAGVVLMLTSGRQEITRLPWSLQRPFYLPKKGEGGEDGSVPAPPPTPAPRPTAIP